MELSWYVLRSKPNKEDFLFDQLLAYHLVVFYPRIRVRNVNPRARKFHSYFPGYLFVKTDLNEISSSVLRWTPGSAGLVCYDCQPASVPDSLINAIRRRVDEINAAGGEQLDGLKPGDKVSIQGGPFSGYDALFDASLSGNQRVRVLIQYLRGHQIPVELPSGFIQKKTPPK